MNVPDDVADSIDRVAQKMLDGHKLAPEDFDMIAGAMATMAFKFGLMGEKLPEIPPMIDSRKQLILDAYDSGCADKQQSGHGLH